MSDNIPLKVLIKNNELRRIEWVKLLYVKRINGIVFS